MPPPPPAGGPVLPPRRTGMWIVVGALCIVGVAGLVWGAFALAGRATDTGLEAAFDVKVATAENETLAPSERDGASSTDHGLLEGEEPDGSTFTELRCTFRGQSNLDPPLSLAFGAPREQHTMTLAPGARFDCSDGRERSSGIVSLDATFEELTYTAGVAAGDGRIDWETVGVSQETPGLDLVPSNTEVEIELDGSVIVVWTKILDGPYEGYQGRLVLRDWELILDAAAEEITGVRFADTSTVFNRT